MERIEVFCPATIANLNCGFDVLGLALEGVGDVMHIAKTAQSGIVIKQLSGPSLPLEAEKNVAGVAALSLLKALDIKQGFEISIEKFIKPGSGIGSSAASAAGAVWGINELLGRPLSRKQLIPFAMEGERLASDVAHADNVAPALLGGFTLVRSYDPLDVLRLPSPEKLVATVIHPQLELKTSDARKLLKSQVELTKAIQQWGNLGGLVSGLYEEDYELIGRSLQDVIVEPNRSLLIPGFDDLRKAITDAGALGCGISGSGPSVFALSKGKKMALAVAEAMRYTYEPLGIPYDVHVSKINREGIHLCSTTA
ncbi:homoserine kinase [Aureicoccus marinus]|uniref:Homoserine kinase n=1 Tax=Aureicoccus marinus TaxID=754435 RepID=A0A2S7T634_9FLAO|nr:homoserine kinase [Aureicoccus marinus]PQJ15390.1 homoserine kinase [Aureicoccus marinus]